MHEADAFARHRILVAAGEIERAAGDWPVKRGRQRHKAVIAVEHDQRVVVTQHRAGDIVERPASLRPN